MTCREKLAMEHPEGLDNEYLGGCNGCPHSYGYAKKPEECVDLNIRCWKCWDREVEEVKTQADAEVETETETEVENGIEDSGDRTETKTEEMSYKELLQEARMFADDIVAAAGTDFLLTIVEAQSKFIFELLRIIKRKK